MNETEQENTSAEPTTEAETPAQIAPPLPETHRPSFWMRALRVLLSILILIGLGVLLVIFVLYRPTREALERANQKIAELTNESTTQMREASLEIDRLSSLEIKNDELQTALDQATLRLTILQVRFDVVAAQLALANEDANKASLSLSKTADTLTSLEKLLPQDQQKIVTDLKNRLTLVLSEIEENPYAARSDLDVMNASLLELENTILRQ